MIRQATAERELFGDWEASGRIPPVLAVCRSRSHQVGQAVYESVEQRVDIARPDPRIVKIHQSFMRLEARALGTSVCDLPGQAEEPRGRLSHACEVAFFASLDPDPFAFGL